MAYLVRLGVKAFMFNLPKHSSDGNQRGPTLRPNIWLIAADSLSVHSAITLGLISFINNINAFNGFFICGFFFSGSGLGLFWQLLAESGILPCLKRDASYM